MNYVEAFVDYANSSLEKLGKSIAKVFSKENLGKLKNVKDLPKNLMKKIEDAIAKGNDQRKKFGGPIEEFCH